MDYSDLEPDPWSHARTWVTRWEGMSSDLYVTGVPRNRAPEVLAILRDRGTDFSLEASDGVDRPLPETVDAAFKDPDLALTARVRVSGLPLTIYMLVDDDGEGSPDTCDFDCTFWADQAFPGEDSQAHRAMFEQLVQVALDMCEAGTGDRVVLTDEGYDYRPESGTTIWRRSPRRGGEEGGRSP